MPLSLNEIKDRALAFSREWEGERSEWHEKQVVKAWENIKAND